MIGDYGKLERKYVKTQKAILFLNDQRYREISKNILGRRENTRGRYINKFMII